MADKAFLRLCDAGDDVAIHRALREGNYTENDIKNILIYLNLARKDVYYTWVVDYAIQKNYLTYMAMIVGNLHHMGYVQRAIELFNQYGPLTQPQRDMLVLHAGPQMMEHIVQYSLSLNGINRCLKQPQPTIYEPAATQFRLAIGPFIQQQQHDVGELVDWLQEWNADFLEILTQATVASDLIRLELMVQLIEEMNEVVTPVLQQILVERQMNYLEMILPIEECAEQTLPACVSVETVVFWLDHGGQVEEINDLVFGAIHTRYLIYSKVRRPEVKQAMLDEYPALSGYIQNLQTTMRLRTPLPTDMIKHIYDRYIHQ